MDANAIRLATQTVAARPDPYRLDCMAERNAAGRHYSTVEILERLVAFDTTSCKSNLELIAYVRDYLDAHRIPYRVSTDETVDLGTLVFPIVASGGASEQQRDARLGSFVWAPDSKAVAFEDQVDGNRSIVLVTIGDDGNMTPQFFPMSLTLLCSTNEVAPEQFIWDSLKLQVTSGPKRLVNVSAKAAKGFFQKVLTIFPQDFKAVESEHSKPAKKKAAKGTSDSGTTR